MRDTSGVDQVDSSRFNYVINKYIDQEIIRELAGTDRCCRQNNYRDPFSLKSSIIPARRDEDARGKLSCHTRTFSFDVVAR